MLGRGNVITGGLTVVAACASLAAPQAASAQTYSRGCRTYNAPVAYVDYQPQRYAPVYTDRQVVYTAPRRSSYVDYVNRAPVREVVRYVPQPVRTRAVYVQPRSEYYPRTVVYSSGHRYGYGRHYGYRTSYRGSHHGLRYFGRRHHRSRSFHLDVGRLHIGSRRGHHGGFSLRVGH